MGKTRTRALDPHLRGDDSKKAAAIAPPSDVTPDGTLLLYVVIPHGPLLTFDVIPDGAQRRAGIQTGIP